MAPGPLDGMDDLYSYLIATGQVGDPDIMRKIAAKTAGGGPIPVGTKDDFKASRIAGHDPESMMGKAKAEADLKKKLNRVSDPDLINPEYGLNWVEVLRDIRKEASTSTSTSSKLSGRESFIRWESSLKTSVMIHPLVLNHLIGQEHGPKHSEGIKATSNWNENLDRHLASTIATTLVGAPLISWLYFQQTRDPSQLYGSELMEVLRDSYYSTNKHLKALITKEIENFKQNPNESVQSYQSRFELLYIKALDNKVMWFEHEQFKTVLKGVEVKFEVIQVDLEDMVEWEKSSMQAVMDYGNVDNNVQLIWNKMREREDFLSLQAS